MLIMTTTCTGLEVEIICRILAATGTAVSQTIVEKGIMSSFGLIIESYILRTVVIIGKTNSYAKNTDTG